MNTKSNQVSIKTQVKKIKKLNNFKGFRNYDMQGSFSPRVLESSSKVPDLLNELDSKNSEIIILNKKIQELEKQKNEMLLDLEKYENDFQLSEKKFLSIQNDLADKVNILEMEVRKKQKIKNLKI